MRFFKYLTFLITFFLSLNAYSNQVPVYYSDFHPDKTFPTKQEACNYILKNNYPGQNTTHWTATITESISTCVIFNTLYNLTVSNTVIKTKYVIQECWHPDYKIVVQSINEPIKKSICIPNNGVMCKYTTSNINNVPIVNGLITTTFNSVSKTPDPACKEELANPPCDPKDPYGGCYTPPNQECTRQFDGSIVCPEDKEPPIQKGCNGADYCDRPPQGCGEGYVSGTYNGKRICIKTNPSSGSDAGGSDGGGSDGGGSDGGGSDGGGSDGGGSDGGGSDGGGSDGGGSDGGGSDGGGSDGGGSGGGLPVTNDLLGVINAIKNVASKIDHYSKEMIESIDSMSKKITGKLDISNEHLEQIEDHTYAVKNNTSQTNDLLTQINEKLGSNGSTPADPNNPPADGVDLTETNGLLSEIRDGINDIKNVFTDEGKADLEQIGTVSDDSRYINAQVQAQSSINSLANKLTFGSSACPPDFPLSLPLFGTINIALSQICGLLALIKILLHLIVLLASLRMIDATVRAI